MTSQSDDDLLNAYARDGSREAFSKLVSRHIHMVHAAAMRQTRDPHMADDVTQAAFIVLAKRAADICGRGNLAGWLILTTRYAALAAIKARSRRNFHERKAASMKDTAEVAGADHAAQAVAPLLDAALSRLNETDRSVISLRYLQGRAFEEVATATGLSRVAAQKRAARALLKLRDYFTRHGVTMPAEALEASLIWHASHSAPPSLVSAIAAHTSAPAGSASTSLASAILKTMAYSQIKIVACACAAIAIIAAGVAIPAYRHSARPAHAPIAAPELTPVATLVAIKPPVKPEINDAIPVAANNGNGIDLANVMFINGRPPRPGASPQYLVGVDSTTRRTDSPAGYIKSMSGESVLGQGTLVLPADKFRGKRMRLTGSLKTLDVPGWAGMRMVVYTASGQILADDDMRSRGIVGTTDWERHQIVEDVPDNADRIVISAYLHGSGQLWTDAMRLENVSADIPTTDDTNWHLYSPTARSYTAALDQSEMRNGHPTLRIAANDAPRAAWANYDRNDRMPTQFLGKRIHLSAWVKSQKLTMSAGLLIQVLGHDDNAISTEGQRGHRPIKGTTGWTRYDAYADVPENATCISMGVTMGGNGRLWVDDVRYEVAEPMAVMK